MSPRTHGEPVEFDDDWDYEDAEDVETFRVSRQHRYRPRWVTWLVILVVAGLLAGGLGIVWVNRQINPPGHPGAVVHVTIPKNASAAAVADILAKAKVINSPSLFAFYVKFTSAGSILPGSYTFHQNERYDDVITALEKPPVVVLAKLTIPEGFTLSQIAARVGTLPGRSAARFLAAATSGQVKSRYQPPNSTNLEGMLFPATYEFAPTDDETTILAEMVRQFDGTMANIGIDQAAARLGLTAYQIVTVASIVEREAKLDEDRGPIASVIYNRLQKGTPLQIDSTVLYGQQQTDPHKIDVKSNTPYNTYRVKGLPPTPIASPGVPSLEAAAAPPATTYLYYVLINANGKQAFASTAAEFDKLKAQARAAGLL